MWLTLFLLTLGTTILTSHAEANIEKLPADCGRFLSFKYFVGNLTEFDDYPWLALLEYDTPTGKRAACGGVLISQRYVLTAAHCVSYLNSNWSLASVRLGEYDTSTDIDCISDGNAINSSTCMPEAISINIAKSIVHEEYHRSRDHDLALLRLNEDVKFTEFIKPICLPKKLPQKQKYHIAGWGRLAGRIGSSVKLRSSISLVNDSLCRSWYAQENFRLANDQFCAGGNEDEEVCLADSGGPFMGVEKTEDGIVRMSVFGVLTMDSRFCDAGGWPGVYTNVLNYRDWIIKNIE